MADMEINGEKKKKKITITRKIQLLFNTPNPDEVKDFYTILYNWQSIVHRSANYISLHSYLRDFHKDLFYVQTEAAAKVNLAKSETESDVLEWTLNSNISHILQVFASLPEKKKMEVFNTSDTNTTYRLLSKYFKGQIPMAIITSLNNTIVKTYNEERKEYAAGMRSLRTYKRNIPIPVRASDFIRMRKHEDEYKGKTYHGYAFTLYGLPFKTRFGLDLSGNQLIWERMIENEYQLCDSSIQIVKNKIFLLAVFQFDKQDIKVDKDIILEASLDIDVPITVNIGKKTMSIGNREEFLHRRQSIQETMRRLQRDLKSAVGGRGRSHKLQALDRYKKYESNYVDWKAHCFSRELVKLAMEYGCGTITLKDQVKKEEELKAILDTDEGKLVMRNWSYGNLFTKIKDKANRIGIIVKKEGKEKDSDNLV